MKNTFFALALFSLFFGNKAIAQDTIVPSVEKSIKGLQIGLGAWTYGEFKLANKFSLRTEVGLNGSIWYRKSMYFGEDMGFILTPVLRAEPRWYYNLNARVKKGRTIRSNSGNFVSLPISYAPNWFLISSKENESGDMRQQISFIPTWGIRRALGKHFDYELGLGIGYSYAFKYEVKNLEYKSEDEVIVNARLRIGYHF